MWKTFILFYFCYARTCLNNDSPNTEVYHTWGMDKWSYPKSILWGEIMYPCINVSGNLAQVMTRVIYPQMYQYILLNPVSRGVKSENGPCDNLWCHRWRQNFAVTGDTIGCHNDNPPCHPGDNKIASMATRGFQWA